MGRPPDWAYFFHYTSWRAKKEYFMAKKDEKRGNSFYHPLSFFGGL
jgi:hypothetical protein